MILKRFISLLPLLVLLGWVSTSWAQPFRDGEDYKLGVTMGLNVTQLTGTELKDPGIKTGMVIGAYYRKELTKNWHLSSEIAFSLRGSNFAHGAENEYYAMKFVYMDFPLALMYKVVDDENKQFALIGLEPSYMLQSEIYINPEFRAQYRNYGFKPFDLATQVGYHFDFYYFGFRPSIKIGLLNINDNLNLEGVTPETGKGGSIRNFTMDFKFFF
ncbi:MAG: PorT family protein [Flavobacteriales bacterium]|nr:PorT family protein [Flavobacteriales bacterium]